MQKYFFLFVLLQIYRVKTQYLMRYPATPFATQNFQRIAPNAEIFYQNNDFVNVKSDSSSGQESNEFENYEENLSKGAEVKSLDLIIEDVNNEMSEIKMKLNEDYRRLTNLDQQNEEKAKKTIQDTRREIENRVGYVQELLYKKRDDSSVDTSSNVMGCVSDSLNRLAQITPELMQDEENCIQSELTMSRSVAQVTHDLIKEYLHKVKVQQERLNKCNSMKSRKLCLVNMYNGLVDFKTNLKSSVAMKMSETVSFLNVLSSRMRTCAQAQVGKVVNRAGDVIVKFNACVQGVEIEEEIDNRTNEKSEMLLFVV